MNALRPAHCRSCDASIIWATSPAGRTLPLDAEPISGFGDLRMTSRSILYRLDEGQAVRAFMTSPEESERLYISHFQSCPNAAQHSRR